MSRYDGPDNCFLVAAPASSNRPISTSGFTPSNVPVEAGWLLTNFPVGVPVETLWEGRNATVHGPAVGHPPLPCPRSGGWKAFSEPTAHRPRPHGRFRVMTPVQEPKARIFSDSPVQPATATSKATECSRSEQMVAHDRPTASRNRGGDVPDPLRFAGSAQPGRVTRPVSHGGWTLTAPRKFRPGT